MEGRILNMWKIRKPNNTTEHSRTKCMGKDKELKGNVKERTENVKKLKGSVKECMGSRNERVGNDKE